MHAPNRATRIIAPARQDFYAGVCQSDCPFSETSGWFVPYRRMGGGRYEAVINLFVLDSSSAFMGAVPFIVDTGSDVTVIPRSLLDDGAFRPEPNKHYGIEGISGGRMVVGHRFKASLSIPRRRRGPEPLKFVELRPMVVKNWPMSYGLLGLDALRQVLMVSDREHVSFWPSTTGTCETG